jgi:magnesium transporter
MMTETSKPVVSKEGAERPERPWEVLAALIEQSAEQQIQDFLERLPVEDLSFAVSRLDDPEQHRLLELLPPEVSAWVLKEVPEIRAPDLLEQLRPETAAPIIHALASDARADLIGEMDRPEAEAILGLLEPDEAEQIRKLVLYPVTEAGGLMIQEFLAYPASWTTHQVIEDLRDHQQDYANYESQYIYAVDEDQRLLGVVPIRNLLLTPRAAAISHTMIRDPITIPDHADLDEIEDWFDRYSFVGLPVVDADQVLLGVLTRRSVLLALSRRADQDFLRRQGLVEEELRSMPLWRRSRGRLSWLSVNILLNILAASVIAMHQDTLAAVIALAVFLPIISDMSGCSGNQAVAVSMRELALGVVRPQEILHVLWKEVLVGLINGTVLGAMIAAVAWLWKGNAWLGLVVGVAMAANTLIAVCIGGTVPLFIKRIGKDPALASGPILTTITDLCGFLLILTIASLLLPKLTG